MNRPIITPEQAEERRLEIEREQTAEKLAQKNHGFVQLTRANLGDLRELAIQSITAFEIISYMVEKMNRQNAIIVSQETLAKLTGKSLITIKRSIAHLEKHKWLKILKVGTANAYVINSKIFWTSTREGRYAAFHAQVITSEAEQRQPIDENLQLKHFPLVFTNETATLIGTENENQTRELDL